MSDIFSNARSHALYRVINTQTSTWPHKHKFVENVFPDDFYAELLRHLPATTAYTRLSLTGKVAEGDYEMRSGFLFNEEHLARVPSETAAFWTGVFREVFNTEFVATMLAHHADEIQARLSREGVPYPDTIHKDMILVRDTRSSGIKGHTSDQKNLISCLFYLPTTEQYIGCGTTLYLPKDRAMRCWGGRHYEFDIFDKAYTIPYKPNSLFMFVKTDTTFHGVEPMQVEGLERNLGLFYIQFPPTGCPALTNA